MAIKFKTAMLLFWESTQFSVMDPSAFLKQSLVAVGSALASDFSSIKLT